VRIDSLLDPRKYRYRGRSFGRAFVQLWNRASHSSRSSGLAKPGTQLDASSSVITDNRWGGCNKGGPCPQCQEWSSTGGTYLTSSAEFGWDHSGGALVYRAELARHQNLDGRESVEGTCLGGEIVQETHERRGEMLNERTWDFLWAQCLRQNSRLDAAE
jgi:hypothetical protein